jgi:hypothetical protein
VAKENLEMTKAVLAALALAMALAWQRAERRADAAEAWAASVEMEAVMQLEAAAAAMSGH